MNLKREWYKFFRIPAYKIEVFEAGMLKGTCYTPIKESGDVFKDKKLGAFELPKSIEDIQFRDSNFIFLRYQDDSITPLVKGDNTKTMVTEVLKPLNPDLLQVVLERKSLNKVLKSPRGGLEDWKPIILLGFIVIGIIAVSSIFYGGV